MFSSKFSYCSFLLKAWPQNPFGKWVEKEHVEKKKHLCIVSLSHRVVPCRWPLLTNGRGTTLVKVGVPEDYDKVIQKVHSN